MQQNHFTADNATIILVQAFEPLPHWFSTRRSFEEPGWENFQRVIHTHVVPYMVQHVKLKACPGYFAYLFPNQEGNDHEGNLITICLVHEWRRKGVDSVMIGALLGKDVSSSQ